MLLKPKVYSWTDVDPDPGPFGLRLNQEPDNAVLVYTAWYNGAGECLGGGNLTQADIERIRDEIPEGEIFVIAQWDDVHERIGGKHEQLSLQRLADVARFVIRKDTVQFRAASDGVHVTMRWTSLKAVTISRLSLLRLLAPAFSS